MKLLVIADDLTGALDTGVKLAKKQIATLVALDYRYITYSNIEKYDVVVIDTNSRHIKKNEASKKIKDILKYFKNFNIDINNIYKKTDSALRGNIGIELDALLRATDYNELHFIPALPDINRTTVDGIHYIDGKKVSESVFARDPFEPVKYSSVKEIINEQSDLEVVSTKVCIKKPTEKTIIVYDAETNSDILDIANYLHENQRLNILAGCAGFINVLPEIIKFDKKINEEQINYGNFLAVCGSINPITRFQVEFAIENGFGNIMLNKSKLETIDNYWDTDDGKDIINKIKLSLYKKEPVVVYLDSLFSGVEEFNTNERFKIAESIGRLVKILILDKATQDVLVTGGDTLRGLCNVAGVKTLIPHSEIMEGVVKSNLQIDKIQVNMISKSGGFGIKTAFVDIANILSLKECVM